MYEGEFFENCRHGNGTQTWTDGSIYIGNWTKNKIDGRGYMKRANIGSYDGCWSNGLRHGFGVYRFANGDVYDGCWSNGLRHGFGVHRFANGGIYVGTWSNGLEDGKGTLYYPYRSKQPSQLIKWCTIIRNSRFNRSSSEKVSGRSESSCHSSHKISPLDANFRDSSSTLLQTADEA
ncbi:phosphatidylinositol 4-phosphate 5-kinase [Trifolium repens]|nr:phosphatidylinositol 4-phosphate 5-kinase [Trifolium repens]